MLAENVQNVLERLSDMMMISSGYEVGPFGPLDKE
jgi:hypothetical protein